MTTEFMNEVLDGLNDLASTLEEWETSVNDTTDEVEYLSPNDVKTRMSEWVDAINQIRSQVDTHITEVGEMIDETEA